VREKKRNGRREIKGGRHNVITWDKSWPKHELRKKISNGAKKAKEKKKKGTLNNKRQDDRGEKSKGRREKGSQKKTVKRGQEKE